MKKIGKLIGVLSIAFFLFTSIAYGEREIFREINSVHIADLTDYGWSVSYHDVSFFGGNILINSKYSMFYDTGKGNEFSDNNIVDVKRETIVNLYQNNELKNKLDPSKAGIGDYSNRYESEVYVEKDSLYINKYIEEKIENENENETKKYFVLVKYDSDLNEVGTLKVFDDLYDDLYLKELDNHELIIFVDNSEDLFKDLENGINNKCEIRSVSEDFTNVSSIDCTLENVQKYLPEIEYKYKNYLEDGQFDISGSEKVHINQDGVLQYYNDDKLVFEKKPEDNKAISYSKVKFFKDFIIVLENKVYNSNVDLYYTNILVFNKMGELLQTISKNISYTDIALDEENDQMALSGINIDGVCNYGTYFNYENCKAQLTYGMFDFVDDSSVLANPNTTDISIILIILFFLGSLLYYLKYRQKI